MNILVATAYYPEPYKYLEKKTSAVHYFTKEWVREGHNVVVIHVYVHYFRDILHVRIRDYGKTVYDNIVDGVRVIMVEDQFYYKNCKEFFSFQEKSIADAFNNYLDANLPDFNPDLMIVHYPSIMTGIVKRLNVEVPALATLHEVDRKDIIRNGTNSKEKYSIYSAYAARAGYIKREVSNMGIPVSFLANSGIDENNFIEKNEITNKCKIKDKLRITYVGRFIKRKNIDTIVRALGQLKNDFSYELSLIGDGKEQESIKRLVKELGIENRCKFWGNISRDDVFKHLRKTDVFVMVSKNETLGLVYLEALAQGCIVIGSKNEGIDGIIVDKENGYLVAAGNVDELKIAFLHIFKSDKQELARIAHNGWATVLELTSEKVAENYLNQACLALGVK